MDFTEAILHIIKILIYKKIEMYIWRKNFTKFYKSFKLDKRHFDINLSYVNFDSRSESNPNQRAS